MGRNLTADNSHENRIAENGDSATPNDNRWHQLTTDIGSSVHHLLFEVQNLV